MEKLLKELEKYIGEEMLNPSAPAISIDMIGKNKDYLLDEYIYQLINNYIKRFSSTIPTHFESYTGITRIQRESASLEIRKKIMNKIEQLFDDIAFPDHKFHYYFKPHVRLSTNKVKTLLNGENPLDYEWISKEEVSTVFNHYKRIIFLQFEKFLELPNEHREEELLHHLLAIFSCSYATHSYAHYISEPFLKGLFGEEKLELMKEISTKWYQLQTEKFIHKYPISLTTFSFFEDRLFLFTLEEKMKYQQEFYAMLQREYQNLPKYGYKEVDRALKIYNYLKSLPNWV